MRKNNDALADLLEQMAFLAELKDANPFKVRALARAAEIVRELPEDVGKLLACGELVNIPGIGKGTQALAKEFVDQGQVKELTELQADLPASILELREVRGLGAKKIKTLHAELGIGSLAELEYACEENRLLGLKGFGEKTQASVLKNIRSLLGNMGKVILPVALQEAEEAIADLRAQSGVRRVEITGDLRRHAEVVAGVELLVEGEASALVAAGYARDGESYTKRTERGLPLRAYLAPAAEFGSRWIETTGPAAFLNDFGPVPAVADEAAAFAKRERPFVQAECRDLGLADRPLVEEADIRGVFHLHTTWSDGKDSLEDMATKAVELGYEYLGVSDHSQTAFYAHGLDETRVLAQKKELEAVQKKFPSLRIFHGVESDILADGALDFPDSFLKNFDFVIASVHGQMRMNSADMTKRICRALRHPATTWLGHWTGRLLLGREGFDFDVDEVLRCAAGEGKSIELNANPYRLDVDWRLLPRVVELGIPIGIHPDAHSAGGLADTRFGVWMARKAGLSAQQVVNTKSRKEIEAWLQARG